MLRRLIAVLLTLAYPFAVLWGLRALGRRFSLRRGASLRRRQLAPHPDEDLRGRLRRFGRALRRRASVGGQRRSKFYPVFVNLLMLSIFGASLRQPESFIERLARLKTPDLPPEAVRYTRRLTMVWCAFFVANGGAALWTVWSGDDVLWALYNGFVSLPSDRRPHGRRVALPTLRSQGLNNGSSATPPGPPSGRHPRRDALRTDDGRGLFDGSRPVVPRLPARANPRRALRGVPHALRRRDAGRLGGRRAPILPTDMTAYTQEKLKSAGTLFVFNAGAGFEPTAEDAPEEGDVLRLALPMEAELAELFTSGSTGEPTRIVKRLDRVLDAIDQLDRDFPEPFPSDALVWSTVSHQQSTATSGRSSGPWPAACGSRTSG